MSQIDVGAESLDAREVELVQAPVARLAIDHEVRVLQFCLSTL